MKNFIGFCFAFMMSAPCLFAQSVNKKLQLSLSTGYQQENFHWSIAGNSNGQNPNIYSELKWQHLGGQTINAAAQWNAWKRFLVYGGYAKQFISSGTVSDTDYGADDRGNATYHKTFNADKGNTQSWSAGAGFILFSNKDFGLVPYIGYGVSRQSLHLFDRSGGFPELNSTYETSWKGPFIRAVFSVRVIQKLKFAADVTYNQVSYNAKANWNLVQTFQHPVSYRHHANGYGINAGGQFVYPVYRTLSVHAGGGYFSWKTGNGTDELYLKSGEVDKTQLNEAVRNGFRLVGGLNMAF